MRGWQTARTLSCGLLLFLAAGCQQSAQQKLIGRWYNGDMSVRFWEDGRVAIFSRNGRADGRYVYSDSSLDLAQANTTQNLVMDVVRDGKIVRMMFDADFLGADRLRLSDLTPTRRLSPDPVQEFAVLRRSEEPAQVATRR